MTSNDAGYWPDLKGREHLRKTLTRRRFSTPKGSDPAELERTRKELVSLLYFYEVPWPKTRGKANKAQIIKALRDAGVDPMAPPMKEVAQ